ncbi:hypothetical protein [Rhizobium paknamense]|uniref:Uncharacterized protein n=1 Tax=Rhizobium paknamense TaxID=1206817 RepID=A0ABU0I8M3_9HYPH|nr:hypothetical protein [Rhizobium paknamense]MDQ0454578.1 hypothetical protein [Rhizobium paknamense]
MANPSDKDPAEGSRETVDKELKRQDDKKKDEAGSNHEPGKPRPM